MFRVFGRVQCSYCNKAITLLQMQGQPYTFHDLNSDAGRSLYQDYRSMVPNSHTTVPVIFFHKQFVGGYAELERVLNQRHIFSQ